MSDFKKEYEQKLITAENAVKVVKSGDWVDFGSVSYTHLMPPC